MTQSEYSTFNRIGPHQENPLGPTNRTGPYQESLPGPNSQSRQPTGLFGGKQRHYHRTREIPLNFPALLNPNK